MFSLFLSVRLLSRGRSVALHRNTSRTIHAGSMTLSADVSDSVHSSTGVVSVVDCLDDGY